MRAQCSVFIAASLDGFIAREDGGIDWLEEANRTVPAGEDCGFGAFMSAIDVLVMGRHTFELALGFDPWPYGETPVVVLSHREIVLPPHLSRTVSVSCETPAALVGRLAATGAKRLYVDGGITIQSFLCAGLIDDITLTRIPILLGSGKPLFGQLPADLRLQHLGTTAYEFGFVQSRYRVCR